jgi:hypothetical protein
MPLDFRHDAAGLVPGGGLIGKVVILHNRLSRWAAHRAGYQVLNLPVQHRIGRESDGVEVALSFEKRVHLRIGETRVTPEVSLELPRAMAIAGNHRLQHGAPIVGAGYVAVSQEGTFQVTELIEAEQRMVTGALEVAVVGRAFLLAVGFADRAVQVQDDSVG